SFKFKVRASNDAHVALLQEDGVTNRNIYEIVIGGWGNTQSVIRTGMQHDNRVTAGHGPLSASHFRDFWISWDSGVISVGTGTAVGVGSFMSWTDSAPSPVRYIAVSTGWGSTGVWRFAPTSDVSLTTNTDYQYQSLHSLGVDVASRATSFTFKVRASNDAHVALLQDEGVTDRNIYEVVIGGWGNTQSVIRTGMQHANRVTARHRPLNGTQFRDFWISWEDGVISVGTGKVVGVGMFMSWTDPPLTPSGTSLCLLGGGQRVCGERILPLACLATGNDYHYHSLDDLGFHLNEQTAFTFWVKTTKDAHIALLSNRDNYDYSMFEIVIGGWGNTMSVIRNRKQGPNLASVRHTPLSGSKHLPFWISFSADTIASQLIHKTTGPFTAVARMGRIPGSTST
ncbi:uncharacterized protein LOC124273641, partial [Haliotis rubra]|uniref:uncharacterized protein LOC124273641 n=1 Tax=Haliotis rubra TaxID=36100 RepID=UPI001EE5373F